MPAPTVRNHLSVHPERVRAALDARFSDSTVARLLACERLRDRLDARLGLGDVAADDGEPVSVEAYAWLIADPAEAARRAGSVLHGQALRAVVSGSDVAGLVAAIGRDAHVLGLHEGALSPPRDHGGDLAGAIMRDGYACLGIWLRHQPERLRRIVLLALPPGTPAETEDSAGLAEQAIPVMAQVMRSYGDAASRGTHG